MQKNNIEIKRIIQRCGCDKILPMALVYVFYIILHGHLSPGGGFQGGILMVAIVLLVYLGHGYEIARDGFNSDLAHHLEGSALIIYTLLALAGVVFASSFCQNLWYNHGDIGKLFSSGTVFWMGATVAYDVLTASIVLTIGMLSVLFPQDVDNLK